MRHRLLFCLVLAAIAAAVLVAVRGSQVATCGKLESLGDSPVAPCVMALSRDEFQKWWQVQRDASKGTSPAALRHELEACRTINGPGYATLAGAAPGAGVCDARVLDRIDFAVIGLDWRGARFWGVRLGDARAANKGGGLLYANLTGASFYESNLAGEMFLSSVLYGARFTRGSLAGASFGGADVRDVDFEGTDVTGADFGGANLNGAFWEPQPGTLPRIASLASTLHLEGLRYRNTPQQLVGLREALYAAGLGEQARKVTFAIERSARTRDMASDDWGRRLAGWFRYVAFEKTAGYGIYPLRPLLMIVLLIPLFAPLYLVPALRHGSGGLWIRRPDGAIGHDAPAEWQSVPSLAGGTPLARLARAAGYALWFSILCAFRLGYGSFQVGDWIGRLQPREFTLGATGWCRTVAGVQSLLSLCLLALTVLCVFGRPFG